MLYNTLHPAAVLKSAQRDKVDSDKYGKRMQRWNRNHSRSNRLALWADNPGLESSTASVVS